MAEQGPVPSDNSFAEPTNVGAKPIDDSKFTDALNNFLQSYEPPPSSKVVDTLAGRYRVEVSSPLPEFNTSTAKAYVATDLVDSNKKLFALVCKQGTVQRHHAIKMLLGIEHPNMITLHEAGIVSLSQPAQESFVLVYSRPEGKKLSDLLATTNKPISDLFISQHILTPIVSATGRLSELNIAHGSIRPDNMWYGEHLVLGDCLSEPCGLSQPFYFEPADRMQCHPSAKGEGNVSVDYYAIAILAVYLLYGKEHFSIYAADTLARRIVRDGAYVSLLRNKEPPEVFNDFLRGLLSGNVNERWSHRNLQQWIEGKRSNIMLPASPAESLRPFEFANTDANTKRELADVLFKNWDAAVELMRKDNLITWVSVSLRNKELVEKLKRIQQIIIKTAVKNEIHITEQIMRMLILFDPIGPIRLPKIAFHIDGMDALWMELVNKKATEELSLLSKFIEHSMFSHWQEIQKKNEDYKMSPSVTAIFQKLDRTRLFIRSKGYGFGQERVLYELNPHTPCMSPHFANQHINSLRSLLKALDRLAPKLKDQDVIDLHIAAFVTRRLGILHEVKLHDLLPHPSLASNKGILALQLIASAQRKHSDLKLPGLTHWLALRILPSLDVIRSRSLRANVKAAMVERAKTGYSQNMADVIVSSNYAIVDVSGFGRATNLYRSNIASIEYFQKEETIEEYSTNLSYSIASFIAYIALCMVIYRMWIM